MRRAPIVGVGMVPGLDFALLEQAHAGCVYGDSSSGHRTLSPVSLDGAARPPAREGGLTVAMDRVQAVALQLPPIDVEVERGRLRSFARATGQTDPVYLDVDAARQAGHRDLPVPPTFYFGLEMAGGDPFGWLTALGVDLRRVLHKEQAFDYHAPAYAGDTLTLRPRLVHVVAKKSGAMELVVRQTDVTRDTEPIAETRSIIVVRNSQAAA
jgi:acyl dehydratase